MFLATTWIQLIHRCNSLSSVVQVIVEYCEDEDLLDEYIKLADEIEELYPDLIVLGNPEGTVARKGAFEVSIEEKVLFSKLKVRNFSVRLTFTLKMAATIAT
jgi:selT/selW/selH-like putative selenoprotein